MIDDEYIDELLVRAGERQRAVAPDATMARRALQQLDGRTGSGAADTGDGRRRRWLLAVVGTAAAVILIVVIGTSGTDTIRTVPATVPNVATPIETVPIETPPPSSATTTPSTSDQRVEPTFPAATNDLVLGAPAVRHFEGLPLTDIAISPDADRIAAARPREICIVATSPDAPLESDRCHEFPTGSAAGSLTWAPDGTKLVFTHDLFLKAQEPDLVELDLASGEFTVLTDDGVPLVDAGGGATDVAPIFAADGNLYFFRLDSSDGIQAVLHRYDGDDTGTRLATAVAGIPGGVRADGHSIVIVTPGTEGNGRLDVVDVAEATSRSIPVDGVVGSLVDTAGGRALLNTTSQASASGLEFSIADLTSGAIAPIETPQLEGSSMRVAGGGLSPDGTEVVLIVANQDDPDGHLLLVADIAPDGSVGPLATLATGQEFAPNDGDPTIRPAGLGWSAEILWTPTALVYGLGPDRITTLPLP